MANKVCKEKCWLTEDGKTLVPDGDEKAAKLFAAPGNTIAEENLQQYEGAEEFFGDLSHDPLSGMNRKAKAPKEEENEENLEEHTVEQLKEIAADEGVEVHSGMLKADIIKAIKKGRKS